MDASERIAYWKNFRKTLDMLPLDEAVQATANFWQGCPFVPYYLDPDQPDTWPTPWQLILENYYCDLAKSLAMLYTICFTVHGKQLDAEIQVYHDTETDYDYNLVVLDQGKYVLNFRDSTVVNTLLLNKNLILQHCYTAQQLKLQEY